VDKKRFESKEFYLYNILPIQYGGDSIDVEYIIEELNIREVTEKNIDKITRLVKEKLEELYWQGDL